MGVGVVEAIPTAVEDRAVRVERLYARHRNSVYRIALRYCAGNTAIAEDVTHDVFLRLMSALDRLDDEEQLSGWFYRVTANRCLSHLERARFRRSVLSILGLGRGAAELTPQLEARSELRRTLEVVDSLPPKERIAFTMLHLEGKSQNEIAETLGHSKGYVSKLIHRATERVRSRGYEVPDV